MPRSWNDRIKIVFIYSIFFVFYGMRRAVRQEERKYFAFEMRLKYNVKNRRADSPPKTVNGSNRLVETSNVSRRH